MQVPVYRNSNVQEIEIGLAFTTLPVDKDNFLRSDKIFTSLQLLAKLPAYQNPPPPKKKIPTTHFHYQQCSCLQWLYTWISQTQLTFLYTAEMGLITDMHTYKSLNLVQHLFLNTLHCTL